MAAGDKISGSVTSAARGSAFQPIAQRPFNVWIYGTFVGTIAVVRSLDGGATWVPVAKPDLSGAISFTVPINFSAFEPDGAVLWAVSTAVADGGAYTSGTVQYQFDT